MWYSTSYDDSDERTNDMARTITEDEANELADRVDGQVRYDYSGRSMYGATCFGVVCDVNDVLFGVALAQVLPDDADDLAPAARTDSMGHDTIVYFPGWTIEVETTDEPPMDSLKELLP